MSNLDTDLAAARTMDPAQLQSLRVVGGLSLREILTKVATGRSVKTPEHDRLCLAANLAVPLADAYDRLAAENKSLQELVRGLEWTQSQGDEECHCAFCMVCDGELHAAGCPMGEAMRAIEKPTNDEAPAEQQPAGSGRKEGGHGE